MLNSINYIVYLSLSLFFTIYVARTLSKNGLPFLIEGFKGNRDLAVSINHLLVVGFYLVNLGFVLLRMKTGVEITDLEDIIIYQASALGIILLALGGVHFANMAIIHYLGRTGINFGANSAPKASAQRPKSYIPNRMLGPDAQNPNTP